MVLFESFFIVYTIRGDKDPAWNCFPAKQTNASPKNTRGRGMGGRVPLRGYPYGYDVLREEPGLQSMGIVRGTQGKRQARRKRLRYYDRARQHLLLP